MTLASDRDGINLEAPLAERWIRYWPGPYGRKKEEVPFLDRLDAHEASQAAVKLQIQSDTLP